jgi:hypothetical protein
MIAIFYLSSGSELYAPEVMAVVQNESDRPTMGRTVV